MSRPDPVDVIARARLARAGGISLASPQGTAAIAQVRTGVVEDLLVLEEAGFRLEHDDEEKGGMVVTYCKSCHTRIVWAVTERRGSRGGKAMPVDADPHPEGTVELRPGENGQMVAVVHGQAPLGVETLYRSHFATCPEASMHRRREARSAA